MTSKEIGFLNEVAAELVSHGITEPTAEQIAEAMEYRLDRQSYLYNKFYGAPLHSVAVTREQEFKLAFAAEVYGQIRS